MSEPMWTPTSERVAAANLSRFIEFVQRRGEPGVVDLPRLYAFSIDAPERFWPAVWEFCEIHATRRWQEVVDDPSRMPGARWFEGARLNFAENLLRHRDDQPALIFCGEDGTRRTLSGAELYREVARLAAALAGDGIEPGDRIAGFLPNGPEAVIAMLAATSLGAVWSSCSPDFGVNGVVDRFGQIEPKVLFAADGYFYGGKRFDSLERVGRIVERIPGIERVVVAPFTGADISVENIANGVEWVAYVGDHDGDSIEFAHLPFAHPLYVMYSSGTTGIPKCIVHGAGGTLIQHLKEQVLHTDLGRGDRIFYFTTCGWMMWNWLVSALTTGATVVLYDGNPFYPGPDAMFDLIDEIGITVFGTSAKFIAAAEKAGVRPAQTHSLETLRTVLSTGSPLAPESFDYVYREVKKDVALCSISGGTDIISCFALGNPLLPVYRGELQCRGLGMKVEVLNEQGEPVRGQTGELACTMAFPSMPVGFWNDPDDAKYRAAYFEQHPGVWCHGDFALLTEHEGLIIFGRSDATLNPGGVRIGTAEIYRQVEKLEEVLESIAVGQQHDGDERVILFVRLREGVTLSEELIERIRRTIREHTSPRHVPAKVLEVTDIPRTRSGKIVELAVRNVIHGRPVKNTDALANPDALDQFRDRPELAAP